SYGVFGLVNDIENFNPDMEAQFSTYAYRRVFGAMIDELRSYDTIPRQLRNHAKHVKNFVEETEASGKRVTDEQIADHMGVTVEKHRRNMALIPQMASLDFAVSDDGTDDEVPYSEVLQTYETDALSKTEISFLIENIGSAFEKLSEKESLLLWLYYYESLTLREIGERLRITEGRVSQM